MFNFGDCLHVGIRSPAQKRPHAVYVVPSVNLYRECNCTL